MHLKRVHFYFHFGGENKREEWNIISLLIVFFAFALASASTSTSAYFEGEVFSIVVHRPCLFYTVNDDRYENLTVFLGNTIIYTFIPNKQRWNSMPYKRNDCGSEWESVICVKSLGKNLLLIRTLNRLARVKYQIETRIWLFMNVTMWMNKSAYDVNMLVKRQSARISKITTTNAMNAAFVLF